QGLQAAAEKVHTKVITTSDRAKIEGATHIAFDEHRAKEIARLIVITAIDNFPNRQAIFIPPDTAPLVAGFSHEYISYMQGGTYREAFRPLNDAIIQGRIKQNRFKDFYNFTENVDLRVVNRKVLESLIKCGAFDSVGMYRSQLL
ncbi:MAG: hypothetical protein AAB037_04870, partial [Chloroflexota bacterium]